MAISGWLASHTYNLEVARDIINEVSNSYFSLLKNFRDKMIEMAKQ
jgi:hypothetical protein